MEKINRTLDLSSRLPPDGSRPLREEGGAVTDSPKFLGDELDEGDLLGEEEVAEHIDLEMVEKADDLLALIKKQTAGGKK